jgi:hypothetical protein
MYRTPKFQLNRDLSISRCIFCVWSMGRQIARFRISIKDQQTSKMIKVELIECPGLWGEKRFRLRVNNREPRRIKDATLTEVFERLRRWLVKRV